MKLLPAAIAFAASAFGGVAHADQCQLVDTKLATAARDQIALHPVLVEWCEPCGEAAPGPTRVATSIALKTHGSSSEVIVNGKAIDLAYAYIEQGSMFRNLAQIVGCSAVGVTPALAEVHVAPPQPAPPPSVTSTMYFVSSTEPSPWWFALAAGAGGLTGSLATLIVVLAARRRAPGFTPRFG